MNQTERRDVARELRQLWDFISASVGQNYTYYSEAETLTEQVDYIGRHSEDKCIADFMHGLPTVMGLVREGEELKRTEEQRAGK